MQEIGHDHRHQRGVVHDERHHERHEEQEPDLPVGTRELQAERDLAPERFVGLVRAGDGADERPRHDDREEAGALR